MAELKASLVLSLVDRATKPLKAAEKALGAASKAVGKAGAQGAVATKKLGGLAAKLDSSRNGADRLGRELRGLSAEARAAASGTSRLAEWQDRLGRSARGAREQIVRSGRALDQYLTRRARRPRSTPALGGLRSVAGGVAGAALFEGGQAALRLPGGFVETAAQFETLEATLAHLQGSSEEAQKSMKWVRDFTKRTPFEMDRVGESFTKLKVYGLEPTNGLLQDIGDTAAVMGRPMLDGVEAIADAMRGENERLKEFAGIDASAAGDTTTYSWRDRATQQDRTATVRTGDTDQIVRALRDIMAGNFGGGMAAKLATYDGMMSNLRDHWTMFKHDVMAAGPFERLKGYLQGALDKVNAMSESGELAALADLWADRFGRVMGVLRDEVWPVLRDDIGPALTDVGGVMLKLFKIANSVAEALGGWGVVLKGLVGIGFWKLGSKALGGMYDSAAGTYGGAKKGLERLGKLKGPAASAASAASNAAKGGLARLAGWLLRIGGVIAPLAGVALKGLAALVAGISGPVLAAAAAIGVAGFLIWKNWEPIKGFFAKLWGGVKKAFSAAWEWMSGVDWSGLGMTLLETLAKGIASAALAPVNALKWVFEKMGDLLPGSDARAGPLSRLTASGMAILPTMGEGVRRSGSRPLGAPLARALGSAAAGLALALPAPAIEIPPAPATLAAGSGARPASAAPAGGVHYHVINRITIQQLPGEDAQDLADRLLRELDRRQSLAGREALGDAY